MKVQRAIKIQFSTQKHFKMAFLLLLVEAAAAGAVVVPPPLLLPTPEAPAPPTPPPPAPSTKSFHLFSKQKNKAVIQHRPWDVREVHSQQITSATNCHSTDYSICYVSN